MRISDWSSDVCSSDLLLAMAAADPLLHLFVPARFVTVDMGHLAIDLTAATAMLILALVAYRFWPMVAASLQMLPLLAHFSRAVDISIDPAAYLTMQVAASWLLPPLLILATWRHQARMRKNGSDPSWYIRSEEHTSELQSLMRISYAVFCLKKTQTN